MKERLFFFKGTVIERERKWGGDEWEEGCRRVRQIGKNQNIIYVLCSLHVLCYILSMTPSAINITNSGCMQIQSPHSAYQNNQE